MVSLFRMPHTPTATDQKFSLSRTDSLVIAAFLTLFFLLLSDRMVAYWLERLLTGDKDLKTIRVETWYCVAIAFPLLLALCNPRRSGLIIGDFKPHWRKVLLLTIGLIPFAVLARFLSGDANPYPNFNLVWVSAIVPIREELIFSGFLYGFLKIKFPGSVKLGVRFDHALLITAFCFSMYHLSNLGAIPTSWLLFQLFYTFTHVAIVGLTRQWTGSILYIWFFHAAANFIMGFPQ